MKNGKTNVFAQEKGVYLFLIGYYNEEGDGSQTNFKPPDDNRHAAVFFAEKREVQDGLGATKLRVGDGKNWGLMQEMMMSKWNRSKKQYRIMKVWEVCDIRDSFSKSNRINLRNTLSKTTVCTTPAVGLLALLADYGSSDDDNDNE